jgi:uncharacterized protein (TIRG00374 family)
MDRLGGIVRLTDGHLMVGPRGENLLPREGGTGWTMNLFWLIPYLLTLTAVHILRVVRWKPLLDPIVSLDWRTHNRIGAVGFMAMFVMPLRLGELVRPYLVKTATRGRVRMSPVLATVVVERVVDGLLVSLVLCGVLFSLPAGEATTAARLTWGAYAALAVFTGVTVLLAGARWQHDRTIKLVDKTLGLFSRGLATRITQVLDAFMKGLGQLPSPRAFGWFILLSIVYWLINGVGVWFMVKAFYLPTDLVGSYAMMACVVVGMMIPNAPGNVGSFWYFLLLPLPLYGSSADGNQAIAFGLAVWLLQLIQQGGFGAWFILRGQVSWTRIIEATEHDEASLTADPTNPHHS